MSVKVRVPMHCRLRRSAGSGRRRRRRGQRRRRVTIECVGGLVRSLLKEVVLQCVVRRHARLGIVLQHASHDVLESQVVGDLVPGLVQPSTCGAAGFYPEHVAQPSCAWRLVLSNTTHNIVVHKHTELPAVRHSSAARPTLLQ